MGTDKRLVPGTKHASGQWGKWKGTTCFWEGCNNPISCRGYCTTHYNKIQWASGVRYPSHGKESRRSIALKHRYGITSQEYDKMFFVQGGRCAICGQPPGENIRAHWGGKLCVDHD